MFLSAITLIVFINGVLSQNNTVVIVNGSTNMTTSWPTPSPPPIVSPPRSIMSSVKSVKNTIVDAKLNALPYVLSMKGYVVGQMIAQPIIWKKKLIHNKKAFVKSIPERVSNGVSHVYNWILVKKAMKGNNNSTVIVPPSTNSNSTTTTTVPIRTTVSSLPPSTTILSTVAA